MAKKRKTSPRSSKDTTDYVYDPVKREIGGQEAEKVIWSTASLEKAVQALNEGLPLKANPFCGKDTQLLKPDLVYRRSEAEIEEYIKCMQDPVYFASKCYIMTPEGLQQCKLRDYQEEYLRLLKDNRFTIWLAARQVGKTLNFSSKIKIRTKVSIKQFEEYAFSENEYELPMFELANLFVEQTLAWKEKYNIYKDSLKSSLKISHYKSIEFIDNLQYKDVIDPIIDNIEIDSIDIWTDTGWKPVSNLIIKKPYENWIVELENGYVIEGADKHILFREDYSEVFIDELKIGDFVITDKGSSRVKQICNTKIKLSMCDLTVDDENHRFYSNGVLSHNSVITAIYGLWVVIFHNDKNGLILSKSASASSDLLEKLKIMYRYLPYYLKLGTMKWNQSSISFDNGSQIGHEAFGPTAGLGKTLNLVILDEFAWTPQNDAKLFYMNIIPTVTTISDSNVCIMSTQNGHNLFYEVWDAAIKKKNIYVPFKVDWYQVPQFNMNTKQWEKRDEKWKEMMVGVLGSEEAFQYQYGTQFSSSDKCLVSRECIGRIRDNTILYEPREIGYVTLQYEKYLSWDPNFDFEELNSKCFFILIDLAEGGGGDSTVFNIFRVDDENKFTQVGTWKSNKVDLEKAALEFWLLAGQLFNNDRCLFSIEWNTYGALFYKILMDLNEPEYDEQSYWRFNCGIDKDGLDQSRFVQYKKTKIEEEVGLKQKKKSSSNFTPGIRFTGGNKSTACSLLKILLEKGQVILTSLTTVSELENFEDKNGNGTYKASYGHDDEIMTCCQIPMMQQTPIWKDFIEDFKAGMLEKSLENKWVSSNMSLYGGFEENDARDLFMDFKNIF